MGVSPNHLVHSCMNSYLLHTYKAKITKHIEDYVHNYQINHNINMKEGHKSKISDYEFSGDDILDGLFFFKV